jgi:peptide deformylase
MIVTFDHPALRSVAAPLTAEDDLAFLETMADDLRATRNGVGLAANQIGVLKRAILLRPTLSFVVAMLNPTLVYRSAKTTLSFEGCLSYPGWTAKVPRHRVIVVHYFDPSWVEHSQRLKGVEAVIAQHEIDHLDGVCRVGDVWRDQVVAQREGL